MGKDPSDFRLDGIAFKLLSENPLAPYSMRQGLTQQLFFLRYFHAKYLNRECVTDIYLPFWYSIRNCLKDTFVELGPPQKPPRTQASSPSSMSWFKSHMDMEQRAKTQRQGVELAQNQKPHYWCAFPRVASISFPDGLLPPELIHAKWPNSGNPCIHALYSQRFRRSKCPQEKIDP